MRLQAEILEEDPRNAENTNLHRLLQDVVRLELQLENALILAQARAQLILEFLPLSKIIQGLSVHWPNLKIQMEGDGWVRADHRALECILKIIFKNAPFHAEPKNLKVEVKSQNANLRLQILDVAKEFLNR